MLILLFAPLRGLPPWVFLGANGAGSWRPSHFFRPLAFLQSVSLLLVTH
jgi:hypothetical protein